MPFSLATQGSSLSETDKHREAPDSLGLRGLLSLGLAFSSCCRREWGLLSEHSLQIPEEGLVSDDLQAQGRQ